MRGGCQGVSGGGGCRGGLPGRGLCVHACFPLSFAVSHPSGPIDHLPWHICGLMVCRASCLSSCRVRSLVAWKAYHPCIAMFEHPACYFQHSTELEFVVGFFFLFQYSALAAAAAAFHTSFPRKRLDVVDHMKRVCPQVHVEGGPKKQRLQIALDKLQASVREVIGRSPVHVFSELCVGACFLCFGWFVGIFHVRAYLSVDILA